MKKCKNCHGKLDWGKHATEIELVSKLCSVCWNQPFKLTSVCRADLTENFTAKQIALFDDDDMIKLARSMADAYMENGYWIDIEIAAEYILENKE